MTVPRLKFLLELEVMQMIMELNLGHFSRILATDRRFQTGKKMFTFSTNHVILRSDVTETIFEKVEEYLHDGNVTVFKQNNLKNIHL